VSLLGYIPIGLPEIGTPVSKINSRKVIILKRIVYFLLELLSKAKFVSVSIFLFVLFYCFG